MNYGMANVIGWVSEYSQHAHIHKTYIKYTIHYVRSKMASKTLALLSMQNTFSSRRNLGYFSLPRQATNKWQIDYSTVRWCSYRTPSHRSNWIFVRKKKKTLKKARKPPSANKNEIIRLSMTQFVFETAIWHASTKKLDCGTLLYVCARIFSFVGSSLVPTSYCHLEYACVRSWVSVCVPYPPSRYRKWYG